MSALFRQHVCHRHVPTNKAFVSTCCQRAQGGRGGGVVLRLQVAAGLLVAKEGAGQEAELNAGPTCAGGSGLRGCWTIGVETTS